MSITKPKTELSKILTHVQDPKILQLKKDFFEYPQKIPSKGKFIDTAEEWFLSTKINQLNVPQSFKDKDIIIGCTQYIETICLKNSWNIQVLPNEYAYYTVWGKQATLPGELKEGVPLIISLPNWRFGQYPDWDKILKECEQKNIDVHIDCAWITVAKDIHIDFDHPNIKSFAMSISKYIGSWNRIGLRWSKQRAMDTITMFNVQGKWNDALTAVGIHYMNNIDRDYGWKEYHLIYNQLLQEYDLKGGNYYYVAHDKETDQVYGLAEKLIESKTRLSI
jgi:hypothetical protein